MRLEQRVLAGVDALLGDRDERTNETVELVLGAVVGVQRDRDVVLLSDDVRELGERDRAGHHVLDTEARAELRATGRELDDAIATGVREALDSGIDGFGRGAVDGREREGMLLGAGNHLGVDLGSRDRHSGCPPGESGSATRSGVQVPFRPCSMSIATAFRYSGRSRRTSAIRTTLDASVLWGS